MYQYLSRARNNYACFVSLSCSLRRQWKSDTIYAVATGRDRASVGIVRISGEEALKVLGDLTNTSTLFPKERMMTLKKLYHPITREVLDHAMVVYFKGPRSLTGEDVVELHLHGGKAVIGSVLDALKKLSNMRLAEAGEFTRRAFYNNKMELTKIEGLADLISAETEMQRRFAMKQMSGKSSHLYSSWRLTMIKNLSHIEAVIDFGEDESIEEGVVENVALNIGQLQKEILMHLKDDRCGLRLKNGIRIGIFGPPNAGKSSFFNALTKKQTAIVSPIPGTTRDVIEVALDIEGYPVILADTAGIRRSIDPLEIEGIRRASEYINNTDFRFCVLDWQNFQNLQRTEEFDFSFLEYITPDTIVLFNKSDLIPPLLDVSIFSTNLQSYLSFSLVHHPIFISSLPSKIHLEPLLSYLLVLFNADYDSYLSSFSTSTLIANARHRAHLEECITHLNLFLSKFQDIRQIVLAAEDLRHASHSLGYITGHIHLEDLLDAIFRDFCLGK